MSVVYLDNAATTPISPEVKEAMSNAMDIFGNPSSTHTLGRKAKIIIEKTRSLIAKELNCATGEIFFTSGGTEADNLALFSAVRDLGVKRIISTKIEHHAVGHSLEFLKETEGIEVVLIGLNEKGELNLEELKELLQIEVKTLVTLMYVNNEIGNLIDLKSIAELCKEYNALFHSDTVQGVGHFKINLKEIPVDFIACAAHKFHGPKGVGFAFVRGGLPIKPVIHGGGQERNLRAGTENIVGIAGLGKAFELAYKNLKDDKQHMLSLKKHCIEQISQRFPEVEFNGLSAELERSNYTVLSLAIPKNANTDMILFNLDMKGIAVSGGSACNSGSEKGSHVIDEIRKGKDPVMVVRVSFSKYTTKEEIDFFIDSLDDILT